ncbi:hypothetical protein PACTADRAFT_48057 [Pachysolen tannophilus NRRL Y-2460]|uniref:AB hydrolase-1 domain-containing protein n=1 Tax=Pachysolen tannophilus NRRL Y-2460 TaxID=669874 RepID=A0A1E4U2M9_PACTA|nr:hypothetical protein PACTADRAFT_48057 [Pachysolen tannophilus NRRL Y-2460]
MMMISSLRLSFPRFVVSSPNSRFFLASSAVRHITYDGTPTSLASHSKRNLGDSLSLDIDTVPLEFDKHSPPEDKFHPKPKNQPIVFLHGLFGNKLNNRAVSKQLARLLNRDVYCLDLRNHGDSPHINRHDYPALAADVEQFCITKKLEKPILIGHSMGAKTAMACVLRRPKAFSALISVDNAPIDNTGGSTGFSKFGFYVRELMKITKQTNPVVKNLKDVDQILSTVEDKLPVRQFLASNLKRVSSPKEGEPIFYSKVPLDIIGRNLDNISDFPFDSEVVRWSGPALFIRGEYSPYVADDVLDKVGRFFPRFETRDVKAAHWLISENPKAFVEVVVDWIQRIDEEHLANNSGTNIIGH